MKSDIGGRFVEEDSVCGVDRALVFLVVFRVEMGWLFHICTFGREGLSRSGGNSLSLAEPGVYETALRLTSPNHGIMARWVRCLLLYQST